MGYELNGIFIRTGFGQIDDIPHMFFSVFLKIGRFRIIGRLKGPSIILRVRG